MDNSVINTAIILCCRLILHDTEWVFYLWYILEYCNKVCSYLASMNLSSEFWLFPLSFMRSRSKSCNSNVLWKNLCPLSTTALWPSRVSLKFVSCTREDTNKSLCRDKSVEGYNCKEVINQQGACSNRTTCLKFPRLMSSLCHESK